MKAAVVQAFDGPPQYQDFPVPALLDGERLVTTTAAALSQLVRLQAAGKHYSGGTPPFVPGADGVGRLDDGQRVYFAFPRPPVGAMAEFVAVQEALTVPLPADLDDVTAAAIANPGMSSWAALSERSTFKPGSGVLINGATGASGRLAIQIARHLGAGRIVTTGRDTSAEPALRALGADAFIPLGQPQHELIRAFRPEMQGQVDVVLDYLWGPSAEALIAAAASPVTGDAAHSVQFINMGSIAGATISLPASPMRSSGLCLMGSGLGSVSHSALVRAISAMFAVVRSAGLSIDVAPVPLSKVETAWTSQTKARVVLTF